MEQSENKTQTEKAPGIYLDLAGSSLDLWGSPLSTLFRYLLCGSTSSTRSGLCLLCLLLGLGRCLLFLPFLDSLGTGGLAGFRAHSTAFLNDIKRSANNGTLVLHGLTRPLLGDFLGDTLLVHTPEENGPGDSARVLALEEQRLGLAIDEAEDFAVATNV